MPPRRRGQRSLTLSTEAQAVLDAVGNYSAYVDAIVLERAKEWTDALALILEYGWRALEIEVACRVLGGYGLGGAGRDGRFLARELERAAKRGLVAESGISERRWKGRLEQIAAQPALAGALVSLTREYWLPNAACHEAIRGEPVAGDDEPSEL